MRRISGKAVSVAATVLALAGLVAIANTAGDTAVAQNPLGPVPNVGGPTTFQSEGATVGIGKLTPLYSTVDLTLAGPFGSLQMTRAYSFDFWANGDWEGPALFGHVYREIQNEVRQSVQWQSGLFSYVYDSVPGAISKPCRFSPVTRECEEDEPDPNEGYWQLYSTEGDFTPLEKCVPDLAAVTDNQRSCYSAMKTGGNGDGSFEWNKEYVWNGSTGAFLVHTKGRRLIYSSATRHGDYPSRWLLSAVEDDHYPSGRTIATYDYGSLDASCNGLGTGSARRTLIRVNAGGASLDLYYTPVVIPVLNGTPVTECVLREIKKGTESIVRFEYRMDDCCNDRGRLLAAVYRNATGAETHETYSYRGSRDGSTVVPSFQVYRDGMPLSSNPRIVERHWLDYDSPDPAARNFVEMAESENTLWTTSALNADGGVATCTPGMVDTSELKTNELGGAFTYCPPEQLQIFHADRPAGRAAGTAAQSDRVPYRKEFLAAHHSAGVVRNYVEKCANPADCEPLKTEWIVGIFWNGPFAQEVQSAERTTGTGWTKYDYVSVPGPDGGTFHEVSRVASGAVDPSGANPENVVRYEYQNNSAPAAERQLKLQATASVLEPAAEKRIHHRWAPGKNRVSATIVEGRTKTLSGAVTPRFVATFFNTSYSSSCSPTTVANPKEHVVEVMGPCLVSGISATTCDVPAANIPLKQYVYGTSGVAQDRVTKELVYSRGTSVGGQGFSCSGASRQITEYAYDTDWRGRPSRMTDANGGFTVYEYDGERLFRETAPAINGVSLVTTYEYDNRTNQIRKKILSAGGSEFFTEHFCYRKGADASCSGGTPSTLLQWKATGTSTSTAYAEKTEYQYVDDRLAAERVFDGSGTLRRVAQYAADPHGRPTATQVGSGYGSYLSATGYENGVQVAMGLAYNAPPAKCGEPQAGTSPECAALGSDALARVTSVQHYGDGASLTCMDYDSQGNVSWVATGCPADCASCPESLKTRYVHDDFGNVVEMSAPWTGTPAITRWEFDAAGNEVKKQTASMTSSSSYIKSDYDARGRLLAKWWAPGGIPEPTAMFTFAYDDTVAPGAGCPSPAPARTLGRVQRMRDSLGDHWYQYDAAGRVTEILRDRTTTSSECGGVSNETTPNRKFVYDSFGRLTSEVYPHGRTVRYTYGTGGHSSRAASIAADLYSTVSGVKAVTTLTLVDNVQWEPYGGLRSYRVRSLNPGNTSAHVSAGAAAAVVEYLQGDDSSVMPALTCSNGRPGATDYTGRLRALWVSKLPSGTGTGAGDLFRRTYTWSADQLAAEDSCVLSTSEEPRRVVYAERDGYWRTEKFEPYDEIYTPAARGFDSQLQLRHASRPQGQFGSSGGVLGRRDYGYDGRGNRVTQSDDCWCFDYSYQGDLLMSKSRSSRSTALIDNDCPCERGPAGASDTSYRYTFSYDAEGRTLAKNWPVDTSGAPNFSLSFDWSADGAHAAVGAVFREVRVANGPPYTYYYDAFGRRRMKVYPDASRDEFFFDGTSLLEDRGAEYVDGVRYAPLDEYLWLDGRPVGMIKSKFLVDSTGNWTRQDDLQGTCKRNGDAPACGVYYPVNDYLPKAIGLLDWQLRVVGAYDYDPFGHVNRVTHLADTAHPYAASQNAVLAHLKQPPGANKSGQARLRFAVRDVSGGNDYAWVTNIGGSALTGNIIGTQGASRATAWLTTPADGVMQVRFRSDGVAENRTGFILEGYDYRRYQAGVAPVDFALRFPGQYYDAESDLFENWNRFYDASTGRYLAPDPLLTSGKYFVREAVAGRVPSPYAYAANNPVTLTDPDGLQAAAAMGGGTAAAAAACAGPQSVACAGAVVVGVVVVAVVAIVENWDAVTDWVQGVFSESEGGDTQSPPVPVPIDPDAVVVEAPAAETDKRDTPDKAALVELVKERDQRGGVTQSEAEILVEWGLEVGFTNSRVDPKHPSGDGSLGPHIHVGPKNHIPIK